MTRATKADILGLNNQLEAKDNTINKLTQLAQQLQSQVEQKQAIIDLQANLLKGYVDLISGKTSILIDSSKGT